MADVEGRVKPITEFREANRFLSNFWKCTVELDGEFYPSVEHAYQAAKTIDPQERLRVKAQETAGQAKRMGKKVTMRPDWDKVKLDVMYGLLKQKFMNPQLRNRLIATGNLELIEGNSWGDTFWGAVYGPDGKFRGQNHLGKLLMRVRKELSQ